MYDQVVNKRKALDNQKNAVKYITNFIKWGRVMTMLAKHHADPEAYEFVTACLELVGYRTETEDLGIPVLLPGHAIMALLMGTGCAQTYSQPLPDPFNVLSFENEIEEANKEEDDAQAALVLNATPATAP